MAKLKVGDIVIENNNVTIHGSRYTTPSPFVHSAPDSSGPPVKGANSTLDLLDRLPLRGLHLVIGGVGGLILGFFCRPFSWLLASSPHPYFLAGIALCFLGLAVTALGIIKIVTDAESGGASNERDHILEQRMARLRPLLTLRSFSNTVEHLAKAAGMTEEAVVDTLFVMQKQELIEEDLDFESAEWYYYLSSKDEQKKHMTLEQRRNMQL